MVESVWPLDSNFKFPCSNDYYRLFYNYTLNLSHGNTMHTRPKKQLVYGSS